MNEFFTRTRVILIGSVISCALWGSAAPCIKVGYRLFQIDTESVFSIWLFAGMRFVLAGLLVLIAASLIHRRVMLPTAKELPMILMLGAAQTTIQYFCYYIGVANSTGVKVSLCNGTGPFISILVSCLMFRLERFTPRKVLGCAIGFAGVALTALDSGSGSMSGFSFWGEGMVILAALSSAIAASMARRFTKSIDPLVLCGAQFVFGGSLMILTALAGGGSASFPGPMGLLLLLYMGIISSVAFGIRMTLLKYNEVSRITIYNFLTPVFGVFLSAIILGEDAFRPVMMTALALVAAGICIVNYKK